MPETALGGPPGYMETRGRDGIVYFRCYGCGARAGAYESTTLGSARRTYHIGWVEDRECTCLFPLCISCGVPLPLSEEDHRCQNDDCPVYGLHQLLPDWSRTNIMVTRPPDVDVIRRGTFPNWS